MNVNVSRDGRHESPTSSRPSCRLRYVTSASPAGHHAGQYSDRCDLQLRAVCGRIQGGGQCDHAPIRSVRGTCPPPPQSAENLLCAVARGIGQFVAHIRLMSHVGLLNSIVTTCIFRRQNGQRSVGGRGSAPDPAGGAYTVLPRPIAGRRGSGGEGKRRKGRREGRGGTWPSSFSSWIRQWQRWDGGVNRTGLYCPYIPRRRLLGGHGSWLAWLLGRTDGALRSSAKSLHLPDDDPIASRRRNC